MRKEAEAAKAMEAEAEQLAQEANEAAEKAQALTAQVKEQEAEWLKVRVALIFSRIYH